MHAADQTHTHTHTRTHFIERLDMSVVLTLQVVLNAAETGFSSFFFLPVCQALICLKVNEAVSINSPAIKIQWG